MNKLSYYKSITSKDIKIILVVCILFYFISKNNYILFHTFNEVITIIISFSIMLIAIGTIKICDNPHFTYLGIVYGFIGLVDLFHTFTYKGIDLITTNPDIPTQLWIAGGYYESIALLFSLCYLKNKPNFKKLLIINSIIISLILALIFILKIFPNCYIEGYGLTYFKKYSQFLICLMLLIFTYYINLITKFKKRIEYRIFTLSIFFKILSQMSFVFYIGVYDYSNFIGHIMKFISFYFLYKALFVSVIINPHSVLFKNLNLKAMELKNKNDELALTKIKIEEDYLKYQKLVEFLPDAILMTKDYKITYANNTFCNIFNLDHNSEIIDKCILDVFDNLHCENLINRLNNDNKTNFNSPVECAIYFNNITIDTETSTIFLKEYEHEYAIWAIRDISDRKKAEKMEYILMEKEKEETFKNEFFSNISHELRTPLNVIYSALQLQSLSLDKKDIKYHNIIRQNCLRLIRITNNIIDTTKIQSDFFKPKLKYQNVVNIIEEITLSITTYSDCKNIEVIFDTDSEELFINCDENLIERIVLNLLSNSVKYGNDGGSIEVSISKKDENFIQLSVKDNGIGIPKDSLNKIFERFEKVDMSTSRSAEGSGIGLYLVKSFVEMQHGTLSINSEINNGTEILISFPIVSAIDESFNTFIEYEKSPESNIIEKIDIEFSDIYI